jgi:hypothetical protein
MEVTAASETSPFCAMVGKSGTYYPVLRRDFTAGNYTGPFVAFIFAMLICCACSIYSVKMTTPAKQAYTRSWATWTCAACFISFLMICILIPALTPGQCPPLSGWGYAYGFGGLCVIGCLGSTCVTVVCCIKGNVAEEDADESATDNSPGAKEDTAVEGTAVEGTGCEMTTI